MTEPAQAPSRALRLAFRPLLFILGAAHVALGAFMVVAPRAFFDGVASYGAFNDHYVRDVATFFLAMGAVQVVAAGRRSWQVPVLTFTLVQYALHTLNHVWDVSDSDPSWIGPVNLAVLAAVTALVWWLLRAAERN
jgi:hypothetical protein